MEDVYEPTSEFLKAVVRDEVPLSGSEFAEANMHRLLLTMRDADISNRDWATMLVAQQEADTPAIRTALLLAIEDEEEIVRAEALLGIAQRDRALALPLALQALAGECVSVPIFEAAALIADPALCEALLAFTEPSDDAWLDRLANDALAACKAGTPAA